ncbi:MetS family NSS transporter small subunit [bacterium]|nr:MetS family NSS transporter small subunit [bacterium]
MGIGAWIMLVFGAIVLYGGFFWCLKIASQKKPAIPKVDDLEKPPETA